MEGPFGHRFGDAPALSRFFCGTGFRLFSRPIWLLDPSRRAPIATRMRTFAAGQGGKNTTPTSTNGLTMVVAGEDGCKFCLVPDPTQTLSVFNSIGAVAGQAARRVETRRQFERQEKR
jgi:hypothetical protein